MLIRDAFYRFIANLNEYNIPESKIKCSILFCEILKFNRAQLFSHMDDEIVDSDFVVLQSKIDMLLRNTPVQYVTGHQEFMSLDFIVTPDVLIPRQDTETLVEAVIAELKSQNTDFLCNSKPFFILELGVGSGCISVSLAKYFPDIRFVASDISESALSVAHKNASIHNVADRIKFIHGDMLQKSFYTDIMKNNIDLYGMFDLIVSNPPYIPSDDIMKLDDNVTRFEPHIALDGGNDGMDFYKAIAEYSPYILKDSGLIFLEAGFDTILPAADILQKSYQNIQLVNDINGIARVLIGSN